MEVFDALVGHTPLHRVEIAVFENNDFMIFDVRIAIL